MRTGVVKFFNVTKGYGFIKEDESSNEVFVHQTGLKEQVRENDRVAFETTQGKKGVNAINVKKI